MTVMHHITKQLHYITVVQHYGHASYCETVTPYYGRAPYYETAALYYGRALHYSHAPLRPCTVLRNSCTMAMLRSCAVLRKCCPISLSCTILRNSRTILRLCTIAVTRRITKGLYHISVSYHNGHEPYYETVAPWPCYSYAPYYGTLTVAIRESDRKDSLNVLSKKKLQAGISTFDRSESVTQSAGQRFIHRCQRAGEENENKKGWGHKGIKAERGGSAVQPEQPEPNSGVCVPETEQDCLVGGAEGGG
ncbi:hypothetical protein Tcan_16031 [Toxocara canis]|uniref:Uncharacterized protein n=1 Tax=Toxocara canis TaxID=6265 RepID=A0A0B2VSB7_TOXCA|nr:hypothetical protein Tcan_16031 [Toxocara canis]